MIEVIRKIEARGSARTLGYEWWLLLSDLGACDQLLVDEASDSPQIARCHPAIAATPVLADMLDVEPGNPICGVRWFEPYKGQDVTNVAAAERRRKALRRERDASNG